MSTGRHHGFESIAEQRLLLALDFAGSLVEVISQPFRLRFATTSGWHEHVPDFLAIGRGGTVLFDVRPAGRVRDEDRVRFAATAEMALVCGWRYLVVTGWRRHVMSTLDTLSSQRRPLTDPQGVATRRPPKRRSCGHLAPSRWGTPTARTPGSASFDTAADGRWARLDVKYAGAWHVGWIYDDTDDGGDGAPAPGIRPYYIRACTEGLGCGDPVKVT